MNLKVTAGFNGPLKLENDLTPAEVLGIVHRYVPVASGALKASLQVYRDNTGQGPGFVLTSRGPAAVYARIQDQGGTIPARSAKNAKVMHFFWRGQEYFRKRVGPSVIKGHHYSDYAFDIIADSYTAKLRWARPYRSAA